MLFQISWDFAIAHFLFASHQHHMMCFALFASELNCPWKNCSISHLQYQYCKRFVKLFLGDLHLNYLFLMLLLHESPLLFLKCAVISHRNYNRNYNAFLLPRGQKLVINQNWPPQVYIYTPVALISVL